MSTIASIPTQARTDTVFQQNITLINPQNLPQGIVDIEEGYLTAHVDGVVIAVESDDNYLVRLFATAEDNTTALVAIEYRKNSGSWTTLKSLTKAVDNTGDAFTQTDFDLSNSNEGTINLDTDDTLQFRLSIDVTAGTLNSGIALPPGIADDPWRFLVTGILETRHILAHGTGSNDGKLVVEDSTDGTITPIIDIDEGVEYVGPTKLAGLSDSLTDTQKLAIKEKLGAVAKVLYDPATKLELTSADNYGDALGATFDTFALSADLDLTRPLHVVASQVATVLPLARTIYSVHTFHLEALQTEDLSSGLYHLMGATFALNPSGSGDHWSIYLRIDPTDLDEVDMLAIDESDVYIHRIYQEY